MAEDQRPPVPSAYLVPASPALARAYSVAHMARIRAMQEQAQRGSVPADLPPPLPPGAQPAGCRFTHEEMNAVRLRVLVTDAAREHIITGHHQARLLPQAIEEVWGVLRAGGQLPWAEVEEVVLDAAPKAQDFVLSAEDYHPETGAEPWLLHIWVRHKVDAGRDPHRLLMNTDELRELHPATAEPILDAVRAARILARVYAADVGA